MWKQILGEVELILQRKLSPDEAVKVWEFTRWGLMNPYDIASELTKGA